MSQRQFPNRKLARVSLMTLDFGDVTRLPTTEPDSGTDADRCRSPKMYVSLWPHIEYQHSHLTQAETEPGPFVSELKARLDENKVQMSNQPRVRTAEHFHTDAAMRQQAIDHTKQWIDWRLSGVARAS